MDKLGIPRLGQSMLHLAPELGLYNIFSSILGKNYVAADYVPDSYRNMDVSKIDLVTDSEKLPSNTYDIILHSHVVEHVPCNITAVLFHLHRALKPGGYHVMCIPLLRRSYAENIGNITKEEAVRDFGQFDHVRRFSANDLELTLGQIFKLPDLDSHDLERDYGVAALEKCRIPPEIWKGRRFNNIFLIKKEDLKLVL